PVPDRLWLCEPWIPDGYVTGIYGAGGFGKSLLALQLCTACAVGAPWIGLPVDQRRCLYFACEDSRDELHRRQADINRQYGIDFAALKDVLWLPRLGMDNLLMTFPGGVATLTPVFWQLVY